MMADDTIGAGKSGTPKSGSAASGLAEHLIALIGVGVAVVAFLLGLQAYRHDVTVPAPSHGARPAAKDANIVLIELGGRRLAPVLVANVASLRDALHADFVLIVGYGVALITGAVLALWLAAGRHADVSGKAHRMIGKGIRWWARFGLFAAFLTVAADCAENIFLLRAISGHKTLLKVDYYDLASAASIVKFCSLIPAVITAIFGLGLAVTRGLIFPRKGIISDGEAWRAKPLLPSDPGDIPGRSGTGKAGGSGETARWERGFNVAPCQHSRPPERYGQVTGICLSGGGVRAASVAMGVLQAGKFRNIVVPHAQYLVSVSGGGYTAGAFAQNLTRAQSPSTAGAVARDPASAFMVGSPEEDHVRRHTSYIADNPAQMIAALGLLAGHLLLTLLLLFGPAIVLGVVAGVFYFRVPITQLSQTVAQAPAGKVGPALPSVRPGAWWAIALTATLAGLFWLAVQFSAAHHTDAGLIRRALSSCARLLGALTAVIAALTLVIPGVIWVSSWLLHKTQGSPHVASPIAAVVLTYAASLASLAWRNRSMLTKKSAAGAVPSAAPRGPVQIVLVIAAVIVLAVGWLLLFGGMATVGLSKQLDRTTVITVLLLLAVLAFLGGMTDETTLSLHPFYRRRLASAFAVRRICREDKQLVAQPYPPAERTTLSSYGAMEKPDQFPHVIFAASATLGQERTPPGKNRVSYTFCADWVGGPDVGYVKTKCLEKFVPPRLARDLTVQGAVALSGAAIAASLGGQASSWYETIFVISGARLGAWMPNPAFMIDRYRQPRSVTRPALPRIRRMNYLLRELFGVHPADGPLLQVTDGGFYDNLGLLELFRRGCTRIYCVDASGDSPPAASTLAGALTLAKQELGVETTLDGKTWSTATVGSGEPLSPENPLKALSARLSETGIIRGKFRYPECGPNPGEKGLLVVAKAALWPALPYSLMAYAQDTPIFPHDSTADQWFDDHQYAAYTQLGQYLGAAAVDAMKAMEEEEGQDNPAPVEDGGKSISTRPGNKSKPTADQRNPIADNRRGRWFRRNCIEITIQWPGTDS